MNKQAAELLTKLLFVYAQHMPENQDALMDAHSTLNSARNLIDALKTGRVQVVKTDKWKD